MRDRPLRWLTGRRRARAHRRAADRMRAAWIPPDLASGAELDELQEIARRALRRTMMLHVSDAVPADLDLLMNAPLSELCASDSCVPYTALRHLDPNRYGRADPYHHLRFLRHRTLGD